jgi:hypothetical protein
MHAAAHESRVAAPDAVDRAARRLTGAPFADLRAITTLITID